MNHKDVKLSTEVAQICYEQDDRAADNGTQTHTDHQHSILLKEALNRERNLDEEIKHEHGEGQAFNVARANDPSELRQHGRHVNEAR